MTAQSVLIWGAFSFYTAATFAALGYLFTKDARASRAMLILLGIGLVLHLAGFAAHVAAFWAYPENRFFLPLTSFFGALSYMSLALAAAFFIVEGSNRLGILGAFVLPWAAGALGLAVIFASPETAPLAQPLRSYWLNFHPMLLMTAYAAFANAAGVGIAALIQERQIKSRKPTELCYRLPSLDELDALNGRVIAWSYPVLLVGLVMGFVWSYIDWGRVWTSDPKMILALATAAIYGAYLWQRYVAGRRGRRAIYLSLLGFASVLFTFFGAELLSGKHSYMVGPR
ncbi:MAG: cytochrome c biogenesis protein CcsA [Elusimicrobiota bacterium]